LHASERTNQSSYKKKTDIIKNIIGLPKRKWGIEKKKDEKGPLVMQLAMSLLSKQWSPESRIH